MKFVICLAAILFPWLALTQITYSAIPKPTDAPKPFSPEESAKQVTLPKGFRLELLASEPLVRQPSGVCRDARGRLFVCELHGYNMEGQYDIEVLNETGRLDKVVRRISAPPEAFRKAEKDQIGVVKLLHDMDGDGRMDKADVWADDLPACLGIVPARDGVIVAAEPEIIFLADRDGDGHAEVRETLYKGFKGSMLERRINQPAWGPDNWIYAGRGRGGTITGPRLSEPVNLPSSDFRFKADGSAIEPVTGGTATIGWTFSGTGQRFVATTVSPGFYVAPVAWRYLKRNENVSLKGSITRAADYQRLFQVSKPHPWRTRRAKDPGFFRYYNQRYGDAESVASGYFTGSCSPMVYQDSALPGLNGHYFVCEPATNLVHRAKIHQEGAVLKIRRTAEDSNKEFLASKDIWFHPMSLAHEPDGSIAIVDFYREIIEDYSAIPRYLQQQYGLDNGKDHGRIWRLVHDDMPVAPKPDMSKMGEPRLVVEVASSYYWRRQTARRLLVEKGVLSKNGLGFLAKTIGSKSSSRDSVVNALYVLKGVGKLSGATIIPALDHRDFGVRVHALRVAEPWLDRSMELLDKVISLTRDPNPLVLIQLALTLGESRSEKARSTLEEIEKTHGELRWMKTAIQSSKSKEFTDLPTITDLRQLKDAAKQVNAVKSLKNPKLNQTFTLYSKALDGKRNLVRGEKLFKQTCAACHLVRGIGKAVGPDLTGEKNRAEETMILDVLDPDREITAGYETHLLTTAKGEVLAGLLVAEAPGNLTLRDLAGNEHVIQRKMIRKMETIKTSLMPAGLEKSLTPRDLADLIGWLRK